MNILALQYPDSGKLSTDVPDVDTGIDWLVYLTQYSQQCQAQSHFVVRSRLDIVENTEQGRQANQYWYPRPERRYSVFRNQGTVEPEYSLLQTTGIAADLHRDSLDPACHVSLTS